MTEIEWAAAVTAAIAIYGAILSTYNLYTSHQEKKWQVKIGIDYGILYNASLREAEPPSISISAANRGHRLVILSSAGIELPDKTQLFLGLTRENISARFPHKLTPGTSHRCWISSWQLAKELQGKGCSGKVKLKGFYHDDIGTRYQSRVLRFDIERWTQKAS